ncbi:hypothetical protein SDC9_93402 [bioreactor metagenome]|uniref:Uncharacterized protein n=1 Tax=bioreactor metagenome TaxID=1076179 RepID=A0A645A1A6_9ZZZZ
MNAAAQLPAKYIYHDATAFEVPQTVPRSQCNVRLSLDRSQFFWQRTYDQPEIDQHMYH